MARPNRKKSNVITVNFKGVEARGVLLPEGEYPTEVTDCTQEDGSNAPYLKWEFTITAGQFKGRKAWTNTSLAPQALWNLRGLLEAMGVEIPDSEYDIDLSECIGSNVNIVIGHEEYEGRDRARVNDYAAYNEGEESEEDDEDEKPKSKKAPAKKAKVEEVEEDEEEEDEAPRGKKAPMTRAEKRRAAKAAEADEDEDEEEEEAPRSKKAPAKKSKKGVTADDVSDMDEDALGELIEEHELDVDLDSMRTLSKKRNAVIDALEENELLAA
jgi:hypothetical protein